MIFPPWVLVGFGVIGVVTLGPRWAESVRDKQIRGLVRRMVRADPQERKRLTELVTRIAGTHPRRLEATVHHAIQYDQRALRDSALATLHATGAAREQVKRLRAKIEKPPTKFRDPIEAAVRIEQLFQNGLVDAAREQLDVALSAFPADPELVSLAEKHPSPSPDP